MHTYNTTQMRKKSRSKNLTLRSYIKMLSDFIRLFDLRREKKSRPANIGNGTIIKEKLYRQKEWKTIRLHLFPDTTVSLSKKSKILLTKYILKSVIYWWCSCGIPCIRCSICFGFHKNNIDEGPKDDEIVAFDELNGNIDAF